MSDDVKLLQSTIRYLWSLLDNIDSADDMAKDNDKLYRAIVQREQKKRWATGITTDGYSLDMNELKSMERTPEEIDKAADWALRTPMSFNATPNDLLRSREVEQEVLNIIDSKSNWLCPQCVSELNPNSGHWFKGFCSCGNKSPMTAHITSPEQLEAKYQVVWDRIWCGDKSAAAYKKLEAIYAAGVNKKRSYYGEFWRDKN